MSRKTRRERHQRMARAYRASQWKRLWPELDEMLERLGRYREANAMMVLRQIAVNFTLDTDLGSQALAAMRDLGMTREDLPLKNPPPKPARANRAAALL